MNKKEIDAIADSLFTEAISGGPLNITKGSTMAGKGETARQMLAAEFFGSSALPFQHPVSNDMRGASELMADQAQSGLGDQVHAVVEAVLEDSLAYYADPDSVGYLINALHENGYKEYSKSISDIVDAPVIEDVEKLTEMAEDLEKQKEDAFLVEQVRGLATLVKEVITEDFATGDGSSDEPKATDANAEEEDGKVGDVSNTDDSDSSTA